MVSSRIITFAYGSNMPTARIRERCPSAVAVGVAELSGYELRWHKASNDGSGKADIVESGVDGASVFGVLYEISLEDKAVLDDAERGYKDIQVVVQHNGAETTISAYKATNTDPMRQPYTWYKALAVAGAKEHKLPVGYIEQLEATPAIEDPERERHKKNMALVNAKAVSTPIIASPQRTGVASSQGMRLHFEPDLDYQKQAIEAVCDLFRGQEINRTEFTVTRAAAGGGQGELGLEENALGIGNRLTLLDDEIVSNLRDIQLRNGLPPSATVSSGDFTVEMETGTGKTYVYLRTIFELNKRFGFTKFMIVVPSVAIKEGVYKTLEITEAHFKSLYSGQPFDYFLYDSSKLGQVRNFATSPTIQIMVVTVGAINKKDVNNLYKDSEKTGGEAPIDLIRATRPVLIVDEPQSVDGGLEGQGKKALDAMHPLCTLRYSATNVDKHNMVYRLDAVDAYERKLVKQIEVASMEVEGGHNKAFVRFVSASNTRGSITAKVELDVQRNGKVSRDTVPVQDGDHLEETTGREIYRDVRIGEIRVGGEALLEVKTPGSEEFLRPGQAIGDVDPDGIKRLMC